MGTIRPQIVLFGDSLTERSVRVGECGWGACMAEHFSRKADVVFRGFGGYNTRLAHILLNKVFPIPSSNPPILVTIFFGANDSADSRASHKILHVPLPEYSENIKKIVAHLKKQSDSTKIILITPPPVCEKPLLKTQEDLWEDTSGVPTRSNELTRLYVEECVKAAQETDVPVINLWSIFRKDPDGEEKYLSDGVHLSAQGNALVFQELLKIVESFPTLKADQMPLDFPRDLGEDRAAALKKCIENSP